MGKTDEDIRQALLRSTKGKQVTVLAEVKAVDSTKRTCDIDDDGVVLYGIRLQSITEGSTGLTLYPKVGSMVLCLRVEDSDDYMVVHASEIEKAEVKIQNTTMVIDGNGVVFNGGSVGSVKADKMVEWMTKVYADIVSIQTTLGSLFGQAVFGIPFVMQTPSPQLSDFADDTLKH